jgi:tetratricopeptide (TPR) repeat protein
VPKQRSEDWYRNTNWTPEIAKRFQARLARARKKDEYLRIQAFCLRKTHPQIALDLLNQFWTLEHTFDRPSAWQCAAEAHLSLGRLDAAVAAYQAALEEEKQGAIQTSVWLDLPELLFVTRRRDMFETAMVGFEALRDRAVWPVEIFRFHALLAVLYAASDMPKAKYHAGLAYDQIGARQPGLRFHPTAGLVRPEEHRELQEETKRLLGLTMGRKSRLAKWLGLSR